MTTEKPISEKDINLLRQGVIVDGVKTKKCSVKFIESTINLYIVIPTIILFKTEI